MSLSPEYYAKALLRTLNIQQPVLLEEVAGRIGLQIDEVNSSGFDGALLRIAGRPDGIIGVRKTIREKERKRFTIAHEIGHYVLPGHDAENPYCDADDLVAIGKEAEKFERAANKFAAEFLLPSQAVRRIVRRLGISFGTIRFVGKQFEVSITAAAVQCVKVADNGMLVMSKRGRVKSFEKGQNFGGYVEMGELPAGSLAAQLGSKQREKRGTVNASVWLGPGYEEYRMTEHSIWMPKYERILTLLVH
jgi:Zn-dependent peptidase ImmA (M78 family)